MGSLFLSELARFRPLALAFAVGHLVVLRLSMAIYPLFAQDQAKMAVALLSYSLLGLILGLYQLWTYRRTHLWAWLVNRPMPPLRIYGALAGAAIALILLVVGLPILIMALYADFLSAQWVDSRHYLILPFLMGLVMCFYFLGSFIAIHPRRASFFVAALVVFVLTREAPGAWIFLPLAVVLSWLAVLAASAFRPDLTAPEKRRFALVAATLPVAYAIFWMVVGSIAMARSMAIIIHEHGLGGVATFAWNDYWGEGYLPHVGYLDEKSVMAHGLRLGAKGGVSPAGEGTAELASTERAAFFEEQIDLADVFEPWGPRFARFPQRHQLFYADFRHELIDEEGGVRWTFSHDLMRFSGQDLRTGEAVGFMGADGARSSSAEEVLAFDAVPSMVESRWLVLPHQVAEIDFELGRIETRFALPAGEQVVMPFRIHRSSAILLSDRRFYLFDPRDLALEKGLVEPLASFELPGLERNLARVQVAEMVDSYLVSLVYGAQSFRDFHEARQWVFELSLDPNKAGGAQVVAEVPLAPGFPDWYRRRGFILSPLLQHGHDLVWTAIGPQREERVTWADISSRSIPRHIAALTAAVTLVSMLLTWLLLRYRGLPPRDRRFWLIVNALLGLPGAVASWLLTTREESAQPATAREEATRALALATGVWGGHSATRSER